MSEEPARCEVTLLGARRCKRSAGPGSQYCYQHQREDPPSTDDYIGILATLAEPDVAMLQIHDIRDRLLNEPIHDARTRSHREWTRRSITLYSASLDLHDWGLMEVIIPADGLNGDEWRITDAGREVLALERSLA